MNRSIKTIIVLLVYAGIVLMFMSAGKVPLATDNSNYAISYRTTSAIHSNGTYIAYSIEPYLYSKNGIVYVEKYSIADAVTVVEGNTTYTTSAEEIFVQPGTTPTLIINNHTFNTFTKSLTKTSFSFAMFAFAMASIIYFMYVAMFVLR